MAINFPVSLDDLANVGTGDTITPAHKNDLNDIVEALEAKVGIDNSAVATSHDYLLTHLPAQAQNFDVGAYNVRGLTLTSDVAVGTIPVNVTSTTKCTNLNADTVDGTHLAGLQTILTNSAGLRAALNDETGSGRAVFNDNPTLVIPVLGVATATSINGLTIDTTTGTLDVTNGKTLAVTGNATISATPYTPGGTDVALTDGGTGASTQAGAANAVLPSQTGNANKVLRSDGTNVSWQNPTDLAIASQARGDILYFDGTNWKRLAKGTNGQYLKIGANDPAWASLPTTITSYLAFHMPIDNDEVTDWYGDPITLNSVGKFKKMAGVDSLTIYVKYKMTEIGNPSIKVYINSKYVTLVPTQSGVWATISGNLDVSGCTNETTYDVTVVVNSAEHGPDYIAYVQGLS